MRNAILVVSTAVSALCIAPVSAEESDILTDSVKQQCMQIWRTGLKSDQFWPSMHAAEALTRAGYGDEVRVALAPKLSTIQDAQHRCGLARELYRAGDETTLGILFEISAAEDEYGHGHACESLFKINQIGDGEQLKKHMADGRNPIKQMLAAAALARQGNQQAATFLRKSLQSEDDNVARIAAWILAVNGAASDLPALRSRVKTIDASKHRIFFWATMATLGDQAARLRLQEALTSEDPAIRVFAAEFCGYANISEAASTLRELLGDDDLDVQIRAAQSLWLLDPTRRS
ncbi:MAG: HEAT repeat domain-containing protein [Blastopirellula sp. JB062]